MSAVPRPSRHTGPRWADAVGLAVLLAAGAAWAASPRVLATAAGPAAHVAVVAERTFPHLRQALVLRAQRHRAPGGADRLALHCALPAFGPAPDRFVRSLRREAGQLRIVLADAAACAPRTPRRAVLAGQPVVVEFAPPPTARDGRG